jgi:phage host-nuclease inhibitor protein Gam
MEQKQPFKITDDKLASWALNKIKQAQKNSKRFQASCEEQIRELEIQKADDIKQMQSECSYFESLLRDYFNTIPQDATKPNESKTVWKYKIPGGKLIYNTSKPELKHTPDILLQYLRDYKLDNLIRTRQEPAWSDIKANTEIVNGQPVLSVTVEEVNAETGEVTQRVIQTVPAGVEVVDSGAEFVVEVS